MVAFKDLTGNTVNGIYIKTYLGERKYLCICSCGDEVILPASRLQHKTRPPSGCPKCGIKSKSEKGRRKRPDQEGRKSSREIDITNQVFGSLRVIGKSLKKTNDGRPLWECVCICGATTYIRSADLRAGMSKSCGCLAGDGTLSTLQVKIRNCLEYKAWRKAIFTRDNYTCQHCGVKSKNLNAHHIIFLSTLLEEYRISTVEEAVSCSSLWRKTNGITLCKPCHTSYHTESANMFRLPKNLGRVHKLPGVSQEYKFKYVREQFLMNAAISLEAKKVILTCKTMQEMKIMHVLMVEEGVLTKDSVMIETIKEHTGEDLGGVITFNEPKELVALPAGFKRKDYKSLNG